MILSQIQRHPSSLPEFLSSKTPRKFPQLPSPQPREGIGVRAPSQGRGEDLESPGPPPKIPTPSGTAHGLGVRFGNSEQEPRLEGAPSPLHLRASRATGSGLEAGDEVAEVTSLRVGDGLLGPEGGVGPRFRAKAC